MRCASSRVLIACSALALLAAPAVAQTVPGAERHGPEVWGGTPPLPVGDTYIYANSLNPRSPHQPVNASIPSHPESFGIVACGRRTPIAIYRSVSNQGAVTAPEFRDLRLSEITVRKRAGAAPGTDVLHITGRFTNTRQAPITLPTLSITTVNSRDETLSTHYVATVFGERIAAGASLVFEFDLRVPAGDVQRAKVTLAPRKETPDTRYISATCWTAQKLAAR